MNFEYDTSTSDVRRRILFFLIIIMIITRDRVPYRVLCVRTNGRNAPRKNNG